MDIAQIEQRARDESHVQLLAIFSFVMAGFGAVGLLFLGMHFLMMRAVFTNPQIIAQMKQQSAQQHQAQVDPAIFMKIFIWFYILFGLWSLVSFLANLAAGFCLWKRIGRIPAIVVGAFNCINIPLGTVLGIFTIVVLTRDSVRKRFVEGATPATL